MKHLISLLLLISLSSLNVRSQSHTRTQIEVGHGPEDIVLDTIGNERLLISCAQRRNGNEEYNGIWEYDFANKRSRQLTLILKEGRFISPHGISLANRDSQNYLFVINHSDNKSSEIIRFRVTRDTLYEDFSFKHHLIKHPNDLYAVGKDEFYYSNDMKILGSLGKYKDSSYSLISKGRSFANGVHVIEGVVFLSTTLGNKIFKLKPAAEGRKYSKEKLYKVQGGDNFTLTERNTLLITSHPKIIKFLKHAKSEENKSPSMVYELSLDGESSTIIYHDRTGVEISAASTALEYNGYLYLAQVFEPYLLSISLEVQ